MRSIITPQISSPPRCRALYKCPNALKTPNTAHPKTQTTCHPPIDTKHKSPPQSKTSITYLVFLTPSNHLSPHASVASSALFPLSTLPLCASTAILTTTPFTLSLNPLDPQRKTLAPLCHSPHTSPLSLHTRSCTYLHPFPSPSTSPSAREYALLTLTTPIPSHASISSRYKSSPAPRHPKNNTASATLLPPAICAARSCTNALNGAIPAPAAIITTGVASGSVGSRNAGFAGRTDTLSRSPAVREARYEEATPMWRSPEGHESGAGREKVREARDGSGSGEDEMEYGRGRRGGRRARKVARGRGMEGKRERRVRREGRGPEGCGVEARRVRVVLVGGSGVASARARMPWCVLVGCLWGVRVGVLGLLVWWRVGIARRRS